MTLPSLLSTAALSLLACKKEPEPLDTGTPDDTGTAPEPPLVWTVAGPGDAVVSDVCQMIFESQEYQVAVGWFDGSAVFGPNTDAALDTSADGVDGFAAWFQAEGQMVRLTLVGGAGDQRVQRCFRGRAVGTFSGTMSVVGGGATLEATSDSDLFQLVWSGIDDEPVLTHLVAGHTDSVSLAAPSTGGGGPQVYSCDALVAEFEGEVRVLPGSDQEVLLTSRGQRDLLTVFQPYYSSSSESLAPEIGQIGGPGEERLGAVSIPDDGSIAGPAYRNCDGIVVVGGASAGAVFGQGQTLESTIESNGGTDAFVALFAGYEYGAGLQFLAVQTDGGPDDDMALGVASDTSPYGANPYSLQVVGTFGAGGERSEATFSGGQSLRSEGGADVYWATYALNSAYWGQGLSWALTQLSAGGSAGDDAVTGWGATWEYHPGGLILLRVFLAGSYAGPTFSAEDWGGDLAASEGGSWYLDVDEVNSATPTPVLGQGVGVTVRAAGDAFLAGDFEADAVLALPGWNVDLAALLPDGQDAFVLLKP